MKIDVSFILVNYNTTEFLDNCLKSILSVNAKINYEIIVIDNNSTDRQIEILAKSFPNVEFIYSESNNGFGYGCNLGAVKAIGKYLLFVNPDIVFSADIFTFLFTYLENNNQVAVCSGILENTNREPVYSFNDFPGLKWEFMEAIGRGSHKRILKLLNSSAIKNKNGGPIRVDWVIGAFMFFRSDVFNRLKGFDEDYFLYYEDVDIQKRVGDMNYEIIVLPSIRICHYERGSVRSFKGENIYYFHMMRSRLIYFGKHANLFKIIIIRVMHIMGILNRMLLLSFRREFTLKKKQKFYQYKKMLKLLFMSYKNLIKVRFLETEYTEQNNNSNEIIRDKFWS